MSANSISFWGTWCPRPPTGALHWTPTSWAIVRQMKIPGSAAGDHYIIVRLLQSVINTVNISAPKVISCTIFSCDVEKSKMDKHECQNVP